MDSTRYVQVQCSNCGASNLFVGGHKHPDDCAFCKMPLHAKRGGITRAGRSTPFAVEPLPKPTEALTPEPRQPTPPAVPPSNSSNLGLKFARILGRL